MNKKKAIIITTIAAIIIIIILCLTLTMCGSDKSSNPGQAAADTLALQTPALGDKTPDPAEASETPSIAGAANSSNSTNASNGLTISTPKLTVGDENCEHVYKTTVVTANCTVNGYTKYICEKCGKSYIDNLVDALGHSVSSWKTVKTATCDTNGLKTGTCVRCGADEQQTVYAAGHMWDSGTLNVTLKTCSDVGVRTYTCSVCKKTKTEQVKGEHNFGGWQYEEYDFVIIYKPHPNTEEEHHYPGHDKYHVCSTCGYKEYDSSIPKHACGDDTITILREGNCTINGIARYTCDTCGYYYDIESGTSVIHASLTEKEIHLCDASFECDALDVTVYHCTSCGVTDYYYEFTPLESLRDKKMYINVGFYDGTSYSQLDRHGPVEENDAYYKHPTWQNVVRDIVYDSKGYVVQFTYVWHDTDGDMYSEVVNCRREEDMYKYFPEGFSDKIDRSRGGSWMLKPHGDHLWGQCYLYGSRVDA